MTINYEDWSPDNELELVISKLNNIKSPRQLRRFVGAEQAPIVLQRLQSLETIEELEEFLTADEARNILLWAHERAYKAWVKKTQKKITRLKRRITYLPEPVLTLHPVMVKGANPPKCKENIWRYESDLLHGSLVRHIIKNFTEEVTPPCLSVKNLGLDIETGKKLNRLPEELASDLESLGWVISSDKLAWRKESRAWEMLLTTFPNAIDASAYNRRLNAACQPGGVVFNCEAVVEHIHVRAAEGWIPSGKDGSGYISPEHEVFKQMQIKPCPIQITLWSEDGWFVKGMLFVNSDVDGIVVDRSMVKGKYKSAAKELKARGEKIRFSAHMGVLSTNNSAQTVGMNFEQSENWLLNPKTKQILAAFMDANVKQAMQSKLSRFVDELADSSPNARALIELMRAYELDPLRSEYVRGKVLHQISNWHRHMVTAAGIRCPYPRVDIDNRVPEGCIIINDPRFQQFNKDWELLEIQPRHKEQRWDPLSTHWRISPGDEVVAFRFPTLLAQGYSKLKVVPPLRDHRKDWGHNKYTVWMHEKTLSILFQGDSDGDQIGLDARYGLVELARHKVDNNIYHIETKKKRREIALNSKEGIEHMRRPAREMVGLLTNIRSQLLCVGDNMGAVATSLCIQQDVDSAKNDIVPIDFYRAVNLENYDQIGEFEYSYSRTLKNHLTPKSISNWYNKRIEQALTQMGESNIEARGYELYKWRRAYHPHDLSPIRNPMTMPQWIYNRFCAHYEKNLKQLYHFDKNPYNMKKLLFVLLLKRGIKISPPTEYTWEEYQKGLRYSSGIGNFQRKLARAIEAENYSNDSETDKELKQFAIRRTVLHKEQLVKKIKQQLADGEMSVHDMITIWYNECHHKKGSMSAAISAVLWEGSPILRALGLHNPSDCPTKDNKFTQQIVDWCISQADPFEALTSVLAGTTEHNCHTAECNYCSNNLINSLVQQIRIKQTAPEFKALQKLISNLTTCRKQRSAPIEDTSGFSQSEYEFLFC